MAQTSRGWFIAFTERLLQGEEQQFSCRVDGLQPLQRSLPKSEPMHNVAKPICAASNPMLTPHKLSNSLQNFKMRS